MANYNTSFSEVIPHLAEDERAWLKRALQDPYDLDEQAREAWMEEFGDLLEEMAEPGPGFDYKFDTDAEWGEHLWLYSEDSGNVDNSIALVQAFLQKFRAGDTWSITWAQTCSKPLVGEFGGGWAVVTAGGVQAGSTWLMVEQIENAPDVEADVQSLAHQAVNRMGDVFYDADQYGEETVACPACGEDVEVRARSCPHCLAEFAEPLSRNRAIYDDAVGCVAWAIRQALAAVDQGETDEGEGPNYADPAQYLTPELE